MKEICSLCDWETGRAGRTEDSLYPLVAIDLPKIGARPNDEIGPLCGDCFTALEAIGVIL